MLYEQSTMGEVSSCDCRKEPVNELSRERGIYDYTKETRQTLTEILSMLYTFKQEIRDHNIPGPECEKAMEPSCFKEDVALVNDLAFAIKGDLTRLMDEFR